MQRQYIEYIDNVLSNIKTDSGTKKRIRQSLTEHIEAMIEKHGALAYSHLESTQDVAQEFMDNLQFEKPQRVEYPWWVKNRTKRVISKKRIFNMPLYHITDGYNPETGKFEVAKGFFAVGPVALGVFSWGGLAFGVFSFGGFSAGLALALGGAAIALGGALGGMAIGGLFAAGGMALSYGLAYGGYASGHVAIGDVAKGKYIYDTSTGDGNAVEWFKRYMPYFVKYFK